MDQSQFINELSRVAGSYRWEYNDNNLVGVARYGKARGQRFNPVTAVARSVNGVSYPLTARGVQKAARSLNLSNSLLTSIMSNSNRGNAQVVRGKLLTATSTPRGNVIR